MVINILEIKDLHAKIGNKEILKGINLTIKSGEIHAVMGPNGSGKSTLCNIIMNHPKYKVTKGEIKFNGKNISRLSTSERANLGLFMGFQHPTEIPGVKITSFLRAAKNANQKEKHTDPLEFLDILRKESKKLKIKENLEERCVNEGFSGGEKKRLEILQLAILRPKIALLDEIDSGLDIDGLKIVAKNTKELCKKLNIGVLLITHYQRILNYITPDFVHVISDGEIMKSGEKDLALKIEKEGYKNLLKQAK